MHLNWCTSDLGLEKATGIISNLLRLMESYAMSRRFNQKTESSMCEEEGIMLELLTFCEASKVSDAHGEIYRLEWGGRKKSCNLHYPMKENQKEKVHSHLIVVIRGSSQGRGTMLTMLIHLLKEKMKTIEWMASLSYGRTNWKANVTCPFQSLMYLMLINDHYFDWGHLVSLFTALICLSSNLK